MMARIGIDLGGTNIAAGVVDENNRLVYSLSVPTGLPRPADDLVRAIGALTADLLAARNLSIAGIESIGIGIPGTVNQQTGMVEYANNFDFEHVPLVEMLQELWPCPVFAENDAKAAALGEYLAGAGRGSSSMVAVTLGTGVGGGIILGGKLLTGYNDAAGELGHMIIEKDGRSCTCGRRGCLEAYASATALGKDAREAGAKHPESLMWKLCNGDLAKMNGKVVFSAAAQDDAAAKEVLQNFIQNLAEGVANIINIIQPEVVCIGGGLSGAGDRLLTPLKEATEPLLYSRASKKNARIVLAELGNDAGLIGAACLHSM